MRSSAPPQLRAMTDCLPLSLPLTPITVQTKGDPCRTRRQTRLSKRGPTTNAYVQELGKEELVHLD